MNEQTEEQRLRLGGVTASDLNDEIVTATRKRFWWPFVNLGITLPVSLVVGVCRGMLERLVARAAVMPIVASTGGHAGARTTRDQTTNERAVRRRLVCFAGSGCGPLL